MKYEYIKRSLDVIFGILGIIFTLPFFGAISLIILLTMGRPVFFRQERTGKGWSHFQIIKFRTMKTEKRKDGQPIPDRERVTSFGRWLRSTGLDELPQLFQVISGQMSFIGPRPLPCDFDKYYNYSEYNRFKVRGGIIPVANAFLLNNRLSWDDQLRYEAYYASHASFSLDCRICVRYCVILWQRIKHHYGTYFRLELDEERVNKGGDK